MLLQIEEYSPASLTLVVAFLLPNLTLSFLFVYERHADTPMVRYMSETLRLCHYTLCTRACVRANLHLCVPVRVRVHAQVRVRGRDHVRVSVRVHVHVHVHGSVHVRVGA